MLIERFKKIGEQLFYTVAGKKWLKTNFGALIEQSAALTGKQLKYANRAKAERNDLAEAYEEQKKSRFLQWTYFFLKLKHAWDLLVSIKNLFVDLKDAIVHSSVPQLNVVENVNLFIRSENMRNVFGEIMKIKVKNDIVNVVDNLIDFIFAPLMPMLIGTAQDVFWKSIDLILSTLNFVATSASVISKVGSTVGGATSNLGRMAGGTMKYASTPTSGFWSTTWKGARVGTGFSLRFVGGTFNVISKPFGWVAKGLGWSGKV